MFRSPYDTTVGSKMRLGNIVNDVTERLIGGDLHRVGETNVYLVTDKHPAIKPFAHPIIVKHDHENVIISDVRHAARYNRKDGELAGGDEYRYVLLRSQLMENGWINHNERDLLNVGDFQLKVFSTLLSENIGRRMNLDLVTQTNLRVIVAYYYLCLFYDEMPNSEDDRLKYYKRISRSTGILVQNVMDILKDVEPMYSTISLIDTIKENLDSVRFKNLNTGLLYNMLGGIWYGSNANENVAIALEHPPTFVAMLYQVTTNRNYRNSILGTIVHRIAKEEVAKQFVMNVKRLVD